MTRRQALEEDATNLLLTTIPTDWGGHVCDRRGEVGREEPKDGRFVAQETQTTLKSARDVIKRKRLRPFPVGKVPTSWVSTAAAAARRPLGGAGGGRRVWVLFSRTAAEIDRLRLPEVSTRTSRTTRPGAASAQD